MVLGPGLKIHILILIPILKIGPIWIWFLLIQTTTGGFFTCGSKYVLDIEKYSLKLASHLEVAFSLYLGQLSCYPRMIEKK